MKTISSYLRTAAAAAGVVLFAGIGFAQPPKVITPDLGGAPSERGWKLVNRSAKTIDQDGAKALRLEGDDGTGFVRLEDVVFADGTIEFDARGRNVTGGSFLGVAFHGVDHRTYDAVYFRPFNFKPDDPVRRQRAVQYISHPQHTWRSLREQAPGKYEGAVASVPDPGGWFHARIVVAHPKVAVFVNDATEPCLVVTQLSDRKRGWVALWVDVSGGDFANLEITPAADTPAGN